MSHTVEKIGGTTMSSPALLSDVLLNGRQGGARYGRAFVVSAFAGVTDRLLEDKRTGTPGVFRHYGGSDSGAWSEALTGVLNRMRAINHRVLDHRADRDTADRFVHERVEATRGCLRDLERVCSHGHFDIREHLDTVRELLASLGEAHSAHTTVTLLRRHGLDAELVDLTGWSETTRRPLDALVQERMAALDLERVLPVVTGYAHCKEGLVSTFHRGYTEITFSRIAAVTRAREAIIHKEYHLSSADPRIVGVDRSRPIGRTNYDVADQLSLLGMEAVHPGAARVLRRAGIPLRVKRATEPGHAGTLIEADYRSGEPCVEIVAGRRGVFAFEVFDHEMLDRRGHQAAIQEFLDRHRVAIIARESNANTITHYLACDASLVDHFRAHIERAFPDASVRARRVAVVCALGSDLDVPGLLASCAGALADAGIDILAIHQSIRAIDIQFVVQQEDYERAIVCLHERALELSRPVPRVA